MGFSFGCAFAPTTGSLIAFRLLCALAHLMLIFPTTNWYMLNSRSRGICTHRLRRWDSWRFVLWTRSCFGNGSFYLGTFGWYVGFFGVQIYSFLKIYVKDLSWGQLLEGLSLKRLESNMCSSWLEASIFVHLSTHICLSLFYSPLRCCSMHWHPCATRNLCTDYSYAPRREVWWSRDRKEGASPSPSGARK